MSGFDPPRRHALAWLAALAASSLAPRVGWAQQSSDQGIGGTGAVLDLPGDQGIGGTGVVGTIRRFGSIVVNDLRITYPRDVAVTVDGRAAAVDALRLGHVVRVLTEPGDAQLSTRHIAVLHEVVGRIDRVGPGRLSILGQDVSIDGLELRGSWHVGAWAAVSGLRSIDGTIMASLVEPSRQNRDLISGPVVRRPDGTLAIGDLPLDGVDPGLVGQRATVTGALRDTLFVATTSQSEADVLAGLSDRLSIEALVQRSGDRLVIGSGLQVEPPGDLLALAEAVVHRAVLHATAGEGGRLVVQSLRVDRSDGGHGRGRGSVPGSSGAGHRPGEGRSSSPGDPGRPRGKSPSEATTHGAPGAGGRSPGSRSGPGSRSRSR